MRWSDTYPNGKPIENALVSAQQYNGDTLEVVSSTFTAAVDGSYELLFLNPGGTYNIVASRDGNIAKCAKVTTTTAADTVADFTLLPGQLPGPFPAPCQLVALAPKINSSH